MEGNVLPCLNMLILCIITCFPDRVMKASAKGIIPGQASSIVAVKMLKGMEREQGLHKLFGASIHPTI
jgi:hypothetical protein